MFRNAFFEEYEPEKGMPDLFRYLSLELSVNNALPSFYYVSGTPWQLIITLQPFLSNYYPLGALILNRFNFHDTSFLELPLITKFKTEQFRLAQLQNPFKKWYLIGGNILLLLD